MQSRIGSAPWVCLLAAVGLIACAGGEQQGGEMTMGAMEADTAALAPKNESGITGSVVLTEHGDSVTVAVMIDGGTPGTSYPSHIHAGSCDQPGGVAAPLAGVTVGPDSSGMATTTVAASVIEAEEAGGAEDAEEDDGAWLVQVHLPGGTPAACGEIS
jgi:hypothetical protein